MRYTWSDGYIPNYVSDYGSSNAKIVIIGEAPGASEDLYQFDPRTGALLTTVDGRGDVIQQPPSHIKTVRWPFVGRAGQVLDSWLREAKLKRQDCFICNVVPVRPEENSFKAFSKEFVEAWKQVFHQKINSLPNVNVIVPTGNTALEALTGYTGIGDWRGSILVHEMLDGRKVKIIPAYHPAAFFHQPSIAYFAMHDWRRIKEESETSDIVRTATDYCKEIFPCQSDLDIFAYTCIETYPDRLLSVDIETNPTTHAITCIGFGLDGHSVVSIGLEDGETWVNGSLEKAWGYVKQILEGPNPKLFHNGFYDCFYLARRKGIRVNNWREDTLARSHSLTPTAPTNLKPHSLDKACSIYIKTEFWKRQNGKE